MFRSSALAFFISMFAAGPADAAAVVIWPVDPVLKPNDQATSLWLENKGDTPVTLQVRTFAWSQPAGSDVLNEQDMIIASPPIAEVAAGKRQLVRIMRRHPPAAGPAAESSYRLFIDELPAPPQGDQSGAPTARLAVQMRYSIPLFAYVGASAPPALSASIRQGEGVRVLEIRNVGGTHARLTDLRIDAGGETRMIKAGLAGYVLAGAVYRLTVSDSVHGALRVTVNGVDQQLTVTS